MPDPRSGTRTFPTQGPPSTSTRRLALPPDLAEQIHDAMTHLYDLPYLQSCPLARLVGSRRGIVGPTLGKSLRQDLLDAVEALRARPDTPRDSTAWRSQQVLSLRYVEGLDVAAVQSRLGIGRSEYFRRHRGALEELAVLLAERWDQSNQSLASGRNGDSSSCAALTALPRPLSSALPVALTSFVGRQRELAEVKALLQTSRLLTLTGSGGCGKSRLALEVAEEVAPSYPDGGAFVELGPLTDPALVPQSVLFALGLAEPRGETAVDRLATYLRPRHLLLVLDNCEHLLAACAVLADRLLRACPRLVILATSRETLGVEGEVRWRVPSLETPDPEHLPEDREGLSRTVLEHDAVRLFVERARAAQPAFALTARNARQVATVCWRLDGIPLAIELAAARLLALTVGQIADRLDDRFRLLSTGNRLALLRHQTLRAAIDWSYDLLSESERALFRRLAVFAGGWSIEAAEGVCGGERIEPDEVLDLLSSLVSKSLVQVEESSVGARYRLLETIRQYAGEKLAGSPEASVLRDRHRDWYLRLMSSSWSSGTGPDEAAWLGRVDLEYDNLRAALAWCLETDPASAPSAILPGLLSVGSRPSRGLMTFWNSRGYATEGRRWLRELLARTPERTRTRAIALAAAAQLAMDQGDLAVAESLANEGLEIAREIGDDHCAAYGIFALACLDRERGDYLSARGHLEEALALCQRAGGELLQGYTLLILAMVAPTEGDDRRARECCERALGIFRELGSPAPIGYAVSNLGLLVQLEGDYPRARALHEEAMALFRKVGEKPGLALALTRLGHLAGCEGDHVRAVALLRESLMLFRTMAFPPRIRYALSCLGRLEVRGGARARGVRLIGASPEPTWPPMAQSERADREACLAAAREALGEEPHARAWAEGQAMTLDEAVEYALAEE